MINAIGKSNEGYRNDYIVQYGIKQVGDSGNYGLYKVGRWSPLWKARFIRYILDGLQHRYLRMENKSHTSFGLHIFHERRWDYEQK